MKSQFMVPHMTERERERIRLRGVARAACRVIANLQRDYTWQLVHGMPTAQTKASMAVARDTLEQAQRQRGVAPPKAKGVSQPRAASKPQPKATAPRRKVQFTPPLNAAQRHAMWLRAADSPKTIRA